VRFGNLDFFITTEGELARAPALVQLPRSTGIDTVVEALEDLQLRTPEVCAPGSDQLLDFDYERLERQLSVFLGTQLSQEDLRSLTFPFANVMMQLTGGEPLSPAYLTRSTPTAFPFRLRNAAGTIGCLTAQRMHPPPTDDEFVGMADYVVEWIHDLLAGDSESISDSDFSEGSDHP
jgi:hypothetical protein